MKKLSVIAFMLLGTTVAYAQTTPIQDDIKAYINSQITDAVTQLNNKFTAHATTDSDLQEQIDTLTAQVTELSMLVEADNLEDTVLHFAFDSYEVTAEEAAKLTTLIEFLKKHPTATVLVEGHTDEAGTVAYNLTLGDRRASAVKEHLVKNGIAVDRVDVVSYGKQRPTCSGANASCWSMNRRVQFNIN